MPDRMKLLKHAPSKKKAVLRGQQAFAVHNCRRHFHLPVTKCRITVKIPKLQPCHEEKIQRLPVFLHDNSPESNSQMALRNQQHYREKQKNPESCQPAWPLRKCCVNPEHANETHQPDSQQIIILKRVSVFLILAYR